MPNMIPRNQIGTILAAAAGTVLLPSFFLPFLSSSAFGRISVYSLWDGVIHLFDSGHALIGSIVFLFSMVFPVCKITLLLLSTSLLIPMSRSKRLRISGIAAMTGKYSLLDVLVIAILIVAVKAEGMIQIEPQYGTFLFCLAIVLSISAGLFIHFPNVPEEPVGEETNQAEQREHLIMTDTTQKDESSDRQSATRPIGIVWIVHFVVSLIIAAGAVWALQEMQPEPLIRDIRIEKRTDTLIDSSDILSKEDRDYYVIIETQEKPVRLATYKDTPIGNGLTWTLPSPLLLDDFKQITLWDDDMFSNDQLDRVTVDQLETVGQHYRFLLVAEQVPTNPVFWIVLGAAGLYFLISFAMCVRYLTT